MLKEKLLSIFDVKIPKWFMWVFVGLVIWFLCLNAYWRVEEYKERQRQTELRNSLIRERISKMDCDLKKDASWVCQDRWMKCWFDGKITDCKFISDDEKIIPTKF